MNSQSVSRSSDPFTARNLSRRLEPVGRLAAFAAAACLSASAMGQITFEWTGGEAANSDWSSGLNWNQGSAPNATGIALFNAGAEAVRVDDAFLDAGIDISEIQFTSGGWSVIGETETLILGSGGITSSGSGNNLIGASLDLELGANASFTTSNSTLLAINGNLDLDDFTLTFAGDAGATVNVFGVISDTATGALTVDGSGTYNLLAANTYQGATTVNAGQLVLQGGGSIAATSGLILNGGTFTVATGGVFDGSTIPVTFDGGVFENSSNSAITLTNVTYTSDPIFAGNAGITLDDAGNALDLGAATFTLTSNNAAGVTIAATDTVSNGDLVIGGSGLVILAGTTDTDVASIQIESGSTFEIAAGAALDSDATIIFNGSDATTNVATLSYANFGGVATVANAFQFANGFALIDATQDVTISGDIDVNGNFAMLSTTLPGTLGNRLIIDAATEIKDDSGLAGGSGLILSAEAADTIIEFGATFADTITDFTVGSNVILQIQDTTLVSLNTPANNALNFNLDGGELNISDLMDLSDGNNGNFVTDNTFIVGPGGGSLDRGVVGKSFIFNGTVSSTSGLLDVKSGTPVTFNGEVNAISGGDALDVLLRGDASLTFGGADTQTLTGISTTDNGANTVTVNSTGTTNLGDITLGSTNILTINGGGSPSIGTVDTGANTATQLVFGLSAATPTIGGLDGSGQVNAGGQALAITSPSGTTSIYDGSFNNVTSLTLTGINTGLQPNEPTETLAYDGVTSIAETLITNFTLFLDENATWTGNITTSVDNGSSLSGRGNIIGNVILGGVDGGDGSIASLLNPGSIATPSSGPGVNGIGTLTITGNANIQNDAAYVPQLDIDGTTSDLLDVIGTLTFEAGSQIIPLMNNGQDAANLSEGDTYTIITADDIIGFDLVEVTDFGSTFGSTGFFLSSSLVEVGGRDTYVLTVETDLNANIPGDGFGNSLEDPTLTAAIASLNGVNTADALALRNLIAGFTPAQRLDYATDLRESTNASGITPTVGITGAFSFVSAQSNYLSAQRNGTAQSLYANSDSLRPAEALQLASVANDPTALAHALAISNEVQADGRPDLTNYLAGQSDFDRTSKKWGVYAKVYGIDVDQDTEGSQIGYDADGVGVQAGFDYRIRPNLLIGLGLGYTSVDTDADDSAGTTIDTDTFRIGPYASYTRGNMYVDTSVTVGLHENDRNSTLGGTASTGDYDAFDVTAFGAVGYIFDGDAVRIVPSASLQYTYFSQDDYTTTGVSAQNFSDFDLNFLVARLGATFSYKFEVDSLIISPEFSVGYEIELLDDDASISSSFASNPASVLPSSNIDPVDDDSIYFGLGLSALIDYDLSGYVRYEYNTGEDIDVSLIEAGVTYRF